MLKLDRKQLAEHIRAKISIVDVVGRYVQLSKSGNNHKGLCPFHNEATPSFLVSEEKGIYKCFGCGEGGDAISFVSKMEGINYSEALTQLAKNANVEQGVIKKLEQNNNRYNFEKEFVVLNFVQGFYQYYLLNTEEGKIALDYLMARGVTKELIVQFGIGLAPRDGQLLVKALEVNNHSFEAAKSAGIIGQSDQGDYYSQFKSRIMFQVTNERGNTVGFSGRMYLQEDVAQAKYVNSPESRVFQKSQLVYNLYEARKIARTSGRLLLFEGFLDVIAASRAGLKESVATMGTALTTTHANVLSQHAKEVILVFDGDKAGLAATAKAIPILLSSGLQVQIVVIPEGLDPDEYIKQKGVDSFLKLINHAIGAMEFQYEYLKQGLRLETTDAQIEFERRLTAFGNLLPDKRMGQLLLRKFKEELYENRKKTFDSTGGQKEGLYRRQGSHQAVTTLLPKLEVMAGEVKAEKELIYYMLIDKQVFELVLSQIGTAFNIDVHRKIVQGIEHYYDKFEAMNEEQFLTTLEFSVMSVAQEIIHELKQRPKKWSKEMIIELTDKVENGAFKLERAGKKEKFYSASHEQQLRMMSELTVGLIH